MELTRSNITQIDRQLNAQAKKLSPAKSAPPLGSKIAKFTLPIIVTLLSLSQTQQISPSILFSLNAIIWVSFILFTYSEETYHVSIRGALRLIPQNKQQLFALKEFSEIKRLVPVTHLVAGDRIHVKAGEVIPTDGIVVRGFSAVDESAITGESAPVVREATSERRFVTAGSQVLSGQIVIEIAERSGSQFIDQINKLASRQIQRAAAKDTNAARLGSVLCGFVFVAIFLTVQIVDSSRNWVGLLLLSLCGAFAICPFWHFINLLTLNRMRLIENALKLNYVPRSFETLQKLASVDVLVLDKTGTITIGDRKATGFRPLPGVDDREVARVAQLASLGDETTEGRSIVVLAKYLFGLRAQELPSDSTLVTFSSDTQMSGLKMKGAPTNEYATYLKGSPTAVKSYFQSIGLNYPPAAEELSRSIAITGKSPLVVCHGAKVLGVIELSDQVRKGLREKLALLIDRGIKVMMLTGDDPATSEKIGKLVDLNLRASAATPQRKLEIVKYLQEHGSTVLMVGDGVNDAPAMAQADLSIAINSGDHVVREIANIIDFQSDPTRLAKLILTARHSSRSKRAILITYFIFSFICLLALALILLRSQESAAPLKNGSLFSQAFNILPLFLLIELAVYLSIQVFKKYVPAA